MSNTPVIVAELLLTSATQYVSGERVRRGESIIYSGIVDSWGLITRSISLLPGPPNISDAIVQISDNWRRWRDILSHETGHRRIMRITVLPEGASISNYDPVFVGEVDKFSFPPAAVHIKLKDRLFAWINEEIPPMVIEAIYPGIAPRDVGGFIPIPFGLCNSDLTSPPTETGLIPLPHIGIINGTDRWAVSVSPIFAVNAVYRHETSQVNVGEGQSEWVYVDPSEYELFEHEILAGNNPFGSFAMTHIHVGFLLQQPDGTEIQADITGISFRGAYGTLPAVGGILESPPDSPPGSPPEILRNPIDFFIDMMDLIMRKAGTTIDAFDTVDISELRERFEVGFAGLGVENSPPVSPPSSPPDLVIPYCDGALTKPMTAWEWLGQFLPSFNLRMFVNRHGKITLKFIWEDDPFRPVFTEGRLIEKGSFFEDSPELIKSQIIQSYKYHNANDKFEVVTPVDYPDVRDALDIENDEKIEKYEYKMYYVRDESTADAMTYLLSLFMKPGNFTQKFNLPAPIVSDFLSSPPSSSFIEPTQLVGLTHSMGLELGGYDNVQVMILDASLNLDTLKYEITSVRYPPQTIESPLPTSPPISPVSSPGPSEERLRPTYQQEWEDEPPVNPARSRIIDGPNAIDLDDFDDPVTYSEVQFDSSNSIATYAQHFMNLLPEPDPDRTLATITVSAVLSYHTFDEVQLPVCQCAIFNAYIHDIAGAELVEHLYASFIPDIISDDDFVKQVFTIDIPLADFATVFGSLASNIWVRSSLFHTLLLNPSATIKLREYDYYIDYGYSD